MLKKHKARDLGAISSFDSEDEQTTSSLGIHPGMHMVFERFTSYNKNHVNYLNISKHLKNFDLTFSEYK